MSVSWNVHLESGKLSCSETHVQFVFEIKSTNSESSTVLWSVKLNWLLTSPALILIRSVITDSSQNHVLGDWATSSELQSCVAVAKATLFKAGNESFEAWNNVFHISWNFSYVASHTFQVELEGFHAQCSNVTASFTQSAILQYTSRLKSHSFDCQC